MKLLKAALVLGLLLPSSVNAQSSLDRPNSSLTPGAVFAVGRAEICQAGYTKKVRHVSGKVKEQVYGEYGIRHHRSGEYEIDHLVPLEIGGANDIKNLWPQPYQGAWNAHQKDKLENALHRRVCAGTLSLEQAQREVAADWIGAYQRYVGR